VGKSRILRRVDETPVMVQTPIAEYYIRPNMGSGGTKISSLGGWSCATDPSTVAMMEENAKQDYAEENKSEHEPMGWEQESEVR
jgi:hypothetical protein